MFAKICFNLLNIELQGSHVCLNTGNFVYKLTDDLELELLVYEHEGYSLLGNGDGHIYMRILKNNKVVRIDNGTSKALNKAKAKELIQNNETQSLNGYKYYMEDDYPWYTYHFTNISTNKKSEYRLKTGYLEAIIDNYFYYIYSNPYIVEKVDEDSNIVARREFSDAFKTHMVTGRNVIFGETENNQSALVVFDLVRFEEVYRLNCDLEYIGIISDWVGVKGIDVFICNYKLFSWDGVELKAHFPEKVVCAIYGKEDYVYIAFENDNCLYAYSPDFSKCIQSKSLPFEGFNFNSIKSYEASNFAILYSTYGAGALGGMTYFVGWSDDEFFSNGQWDADIEQPLFKYTQIPDGDNFSILIELQAVENYGTVARHALAAMLDAIYKHAIFNDKKPYSANFNGDIEMRVINSEKLSQQQKEELEACCLERSERRYSLYLSPVTESSCEVSIKFV